MSEKKYKNSSRSAKDSEEKSNTEEAQKWSEKTGLPIYLYSRSEEFTKKYGDMSKVDKYGRPTHTKSGDLILRFR